MRIGELATAAGVNVQTLRYYERRRLLPAARRRHSGYREYTTDAVELVRFVKQSQSLGFTLAEIKELIVLRDHGPSCGEVRSVAAAKISEMDEKILQLSTMRDSLRTLVKSCIRSESSGRCAIIEKLDKKARITAVAEHSERHNQSTTTLRFPK